MKRKTAESGAGVLLLLFTCFQGIYPVPDNIPDSPRAQRVITERTPVLDARFARKGLVLGDDIFVRIFKAENILEIWVRSGKKFKLFQTYPICYYSGGLGTKKKEGDGKSPEGFYRVKPGQLNPWSTFFLSFNIGYPNRYDRVNGYTGGLIMVHGNCVSIGCYAMTDRRIKDIYTIAYQAFKKGQPFFRIHIFPFRMTERNMMKFKNSLWNEFWKNLKEGYDHFETHKVPPSVNVRNKRYVFE